MGNLESLVTGLSSSINGYLQAGQQQQRSQQNYAFQKQTDVQTNQQEAQNTLDMAGKVTPDMAESLIPGTSKWVNDFQQQNQRFPTIEETSKGLENVVIKLNAQAAKKTSDQERQDKQQDALEKQYQDRLTTVRGDASLMRAEGQRDAAGMAYDTIAKAKSEGRPLSQMEYTDVLGQLWKVRTGSSPTDQVLQDLKQKTAKEGFNRAATYASGNPNLVGATTDATLNNIQQFVDSSGQKADQQWSAYMQPRMGAPTGLEKGRADHVASMHRGLSYAEQKAVSDKTYPAKKGGSGTATGWKVIR